ncbi:TlpA disulfide reductase family protein [Methyloversatilis sp.]|uniref:TlpA family protein disulfide reductase n=1 Tax=Methyloversatilis sp. TaxID=2569862 RepID=UPI0027333C5E|nr:TlpA disulfide reductase family protein [Methyloversatilis sp.]MDP2868846.1 TlpA disulfide reductase family protein [Methyloversatilis sp.]MDP3457493.1 TlpA disulfide reductase family protein [Methyloversatilis sp.]MDP3579352.1 TlpA disulfide reductase family protein [Methyloversatilis sp.]
MNIWLRRTVIAAVVLTAGAAGVWSALSRQPKLDAAPTTVAADRLDALRLADASGTEMPFSAWRGKLLVVNFWATWCPPCREEMPGFSRIAGRLRDRGVQFVGISIDSADNVRQYLQEEAIDYPLLIGGADAIQISAELGNSAQGMPFTVIFAPDGSLVERKLGTYKEEELEAILLARLR